MTVSKRYYKRNYKRTPQDIAKQAAGRIDAEKRRKEALKPKIISILNCIYYDQCQIFERTYNPPKP